MAEKQQTKCRHMSGFNIAPRSAAEAKAMIGKSVMYLRSRDIEHSRGYLSPQFGVIAAVHGRNVAIDDPHNFVFTLTDIKEMVELKSYTCRLENPDDWKKFQFHCRGHGIVIRANRAAGDDGKIVEVIDSATSLEFISGALVEDMLEAMELSKVSELMKSSLKEGTLFDEVAVKSSPALSAGG